MKLRSDEERGVLICFLLERREISMEIMAIFCIHTMVFFLTHIVSIYIIKIVIDRENESIVHKIFLKNILYKSNYEDYFTIGHRRIDRNDYYLSYQILDDGGVKLIKFDAEKTIIYKTLKTDDEAYAEIIKDGFEDVKKIKLYVPKNTIKVEYDFDIKTED